MADETVENAVVEVDGLRLDSNTFGTSIQYVSQGEAGFMIPVPVTSPLLKPMPPYDPAKIKVTVNGDTKLYGIDYVFNLNQPEPPPPTPGEPYSLYSGEFIRPGETIGLYTSISYDATELYAVFSHAPAAGSIVVTSYNDGAPTYQIVDQELRLSEPLGPSVTRLAVTSYNDTAQQDLSTQAITNLTVAQIVSINNRSLPVQITNVHLELLCS